MGWWGDCPGLWAKVAELEGGGYGGGAFVTGANGPGGGAFVRLPASLTPTVDKHKL